MSVSLNVSSITQTTLSQTYGTNNETSRNTNDSNDSIGPAYSIELTDAAIELMIAQQNVATVSQALTQAISKF